MQLTEIYEELGKIGNVQDFLRKNEGAVLCSGLFVLENEGEKVSDKVQLNFFIPSEKKLASVDYPFGELKVHDEEVDVQEELKDLDKIKIDLMDLRSFADEKFGKKFSKIIAVLNKGVWDLTCLDGMLGMCRVRVDAYSGEVLDESKGSLNDIIRVEKGNKGQD